MNAWSGLVRKEFRLGRAGLLVAFLAMAVYIGFSFYFSWKTHPGVLMMMSFILVMGHIIYLPVYLGLSLQREKHTMHHWLHNPLPGTALIATKMLNGLLSLCVSLFIACLFFLYAWWINKGIIDLTLQQIMDTGFSVLLHIVLASIYLGLWTLLLSMVEIVSKQKLGKLRGIPTVFIILFGPWAWRKLEATTLYDKLTHWGTIPLSNHNILHTFFNMEVTYIGFYVFHLVLALLLFAVSSWMLDRKVEV